MNVSDLVNPYMGSVAHMTSQAAAPILAMPHGMLQTWPVFNEGLNDHYFADRIYGFRAGPANLMPVGGKAVTCHEHLASWFDHDHEHARAYAYTIALPNPEVTYSTAVSHHAGIVECVFADDRSDMVVHAAADTRMIPRGDSLLVCGLYQQAPAYAVYRFDRPVAIEPVILSEVASWQAVRITAGGGAIRVRYGVSLIDAAQAEENLEREIDGFDCRKVREEAKEAWDCALSAIAVEGGREEDRRTFYSCLYRALLRMIRFSEYGRYYSGFDGKIHADDRHAFYCNDGMWDTYRSAHPLQMLIEPEVHRDICESYIRMYEQSGALPTFPFQDGGHAVMLGCHTTAMFADTLAFGLAFDVERAYRAVWHAHTQSSLIPWHVGPVTELDRCYQEKGFFPALPADCREWVPEVHPFERRQCVAVTLEQAYDDWCAAKLAAAAGDAKGEALFRKRAGNYRLLYHPETGFMTPRTEDGAFVPGFDAKRAGGEGGRAYFAENNAWIYTFGVPHDIEGLARLMGSRQQMESRLDDLFVASCDGMKYEFLGQFPDATGLMGQFCMGNEPSFHIPYLYNYTGVPWKTQKHVREILRMWFHCHPYGFCGDEDGGALASWYVLTAVGLYPVCPGAGHYALTTPLFDKVTIRLPEGRTFVIQAKSESDREKYIQSASLNGDDYEKAYIPYEQVTCGGALTFRLGLWPNRQWASGADCLPPSMTAVGR